MKFILSVTFWVFGFQFVTGFTGDQCTMPDNTKGICTPLIHCKMAKNLLQNGLIKMNGFSRCGFEGFSEIICCKTNQTTIKFNEPEKPKSEQACDLIKRKKLSQVSFRILNGDPVDMKDYPYQVGLAYKSPVDKHLIYKCSGTLISSNFVLTASHCVNQKHKQPTIVSFGKEFAQNTFGNGRKSLDIKIKRIIIHPGFKKTRAYNDIALIELRESVSRYSDQIYPACLHTDVTGVKESDWLYATGWGIYDKYKKISSKQLLEGKLSNVVNSYCNLFYDRTKSLPYGIMSEQMCAYDKRDVAENKRIDACHGDSGKFYNSHSKSNHLILNIYISYRWSFDYEKEWRTLHCWRHELWNWLRD